MIKKYVDENGLKKYHQLEVDRVNDLLSKLPITDTYTKAEIDTMFENGGPEGSETDTKNTAGATNSTSKLFLVGSPNQATSSITYTNSKVYIDTNGDLYSNSKKVLVDTKNLDSTTGYYNINDGLQIKWGHYTGALNNSQFTITFDSPFPNGCLYADIMSDTANSNNPRGVYALLSKSATSVTFGLPGVVQHVFWIAFGY